MLTFRVNGVERFVFPLPAHLTDTVRAVIEPSVLHQSCECWLEIEDHETWGR